MERSWFSAALLAATTASAIAVALPAGAQSQSMPMQQPAGIEDEAGTGPQDMGAPDMGTPGRGQQGMPHPGGPDRPEPFRPDPLALAARLSAGETYLGIAPDQLAAWRGYTSALIDLMEAGPMGPGPHGGKGPHGPDGKSGPDGKPGPGPKPGEAAPQADSLFGERLADDLLAKAEKAKALKDAVAALKPLLSPAQKTKLGAFERSMMPPPPFGIPAPFRAEAPPQPAAD